MGSDLMFRAAYLCEDHLSVVSNEFHMIVRWLPARVFFSFCRKGEAISAHFSADKEGLRLVKQAISDFCCWAFSEMPWCKMIFACIVRPSVERLVVKCGFSHLETRDDLQVYVRFKKWDHY